MIKSVGQNYGTQPSFQARVEIPKETMNYFEAVLKDNKKLTSKKVTPADVIEKFRKTLEKKLKDVEGTITFVMDKVGFVATEKKGKAKLSIMPTEKEECFLPPRITYTTVKGKTYEPSIYSIDGRFINPTARLLKPKKNAFYTIATLDEMMTKQKVKDNPFFSVI